jgi:hypothetical protein
MEKVKYKIEKKGNTFVLYSVVATNFGGDAKNFVRESDSLELLKETQRILEDTMKTLDLK